MGNREQDIVIHVRLDGQTAQALSAMAEADDRTQVGFVRSLIRDEARERGLLISKQKSNDLQRK